MTEIISDETKAYIVKQTAEIKEAIKSGHKASEVLAEVMEELKDEQCPNSIGLGGVIGTHDDCASCLICIAKELSK